MATILNRIIEYKKQEVQLLKKSELVPNVGQSNYSLLSTLQHSKAVSIIAEFKRASPSKGDINPNLDPSIQAAKYVAAGADAVSVLTDAPFFKGAFADLEEVRKVIEKPILCKDFIIDKIQIDVAKQSGANIILLIVAALSEIQLRELYRYATSLGLEVLIEVHDHFEAESAINTGNKLIGVNNRDLNTFNVDLGTTEKLAPLIKEAGAFLISESGIQSREDVVRVVKAGANGILVGEAFMKHPNPKAALEQMKISFNEVSV